MSSGKVFLVPMATVVNVTKLRLFFWPEYSLGKVADPVRPNKKILSFPVNLRFFRVGR